MADKVSNVLFLCTGNSVPSILGECLINRLGRGKFQGFSAGSHSTGEIHPMARYELRLQEKLDEIGQIRLVDKKEPAA